MFFSEIFWKFALHCRHQVEKFFQKFWTTGHTVNLWISVSTYTMKVNVLLFLLNWYRKTKHKLSNIVLIGVSSTTQKIPWSIKINHRLVTTSARPMGKEKRKGRTQRTQHILITNHTAVTRQESRYLSFLQFLGGIK
jgi:hypothetical protein